MLDSPPIRRLASAILIAVPILVIISIALGTLSGSDESVFEPDLVDELLVSTQENLPVYFTSVGFGIAADVMALGVAAVVYLMFRDRHRLLAMVGAFGILAAAIGGFTSDAADLTLGFLAEDFVTGGATGVQAGDPVILEVARAVGMAGASALQVAWTALGSGLIALGAVIIWAPGGELNPPRWLGWWVLIIGFIWYFTWFAAVSDAAFALVILGLLGTELWVATLGIWLLRREANARV